MSPHEAPADRNPFATAATRPGAIGFRFPEGSSLDELLSKLRLHHGWGQIIGPHGSGKSCLVHTLAGHLAAAGGDVKLHTLGRGRLTEWPCRAARRQWTEATQVIIDGFEQLPWWKRRHLIRTCRRRSIGLLVTAHRDMGLPTLLVIRPTINLAFDLVDHLTRGSAPLIHRQDIERAFAGHEGNVREMLFELFDVYEERRRT